MNPNAAHCDHQREHFEGISEQYFNARRNANHLRLKELLWRLFFRDKEFLAQNTNTVLEPMCGYSEGRSILQKYLKPDFEYEGFDYCDTLVAKARQNNPGLNIFVQDVTTWQPGRAYDLIILIGGLHHVYRHAAPAVGNLARALKPGGYFINYEPTNNNPLFRIVRGNIYKRNRIFDEQTERAFELAEYNAIFRGQGFRLVDQLYPGLLSYVMYYNPEAFPRLNIGNPRTVDLAFKLDSLFFRNLPGRIFSFTTLSLWRKEP